MSNYRKIYEQHYGVKIPKGYHVHHKDFDHKNDDPENLEALHPDAHAQKHGFLTNFIMAQATASQLAAVRNRGRKHTDAQRLARSEMMKGNHLRLGKPHTEEWKEKQLFWVSRPKHSEETKRMMSVRFKGISRPQFTCPACMFIGKGEANMKRWHFDNCKRKVGL